MHSKVSSTSVPVSSSLTSKMPIMNSTTQKTSSVPVTTIPVVLNTTTTQYVTVCPSGKACSNRHYQTMTSYTMPCPSGGVCPTGKSFLSIVFSCITTPKEVCWCSEEYVIMENVMLISCDIIIGQPPRPTYSYIPTGSAAKAIAGSTAALIAVAAYAVLAL